MTTTPAPQASPEVGDDPITESEWADLRAYVNGKTRAMPKWATADPRRHFRRMMAHFDKLSAAHASTPPATVTPPPKTESALYWRNDAIRAAASMARRYGQKYLAADIEGLLIAEPVAPPATVTEVAEIEKRHNDLCVMYGSEPWDEACVADGEQAHMDRARLLQIIKSTAGTQEPESHIGLSVSE